MADPSKEKFDKQGTYYALSGKKGGFVPYWAPGGKKPKGYTEPSLPGQIIGSGGGDLGAALGVRAVGLPDFLDSIFGDKVSPKDIAKKTFKKGKLFHAPEYKTFEGFQEPFFQKRAQDYVNFALPQLAEQYRTNQKGILYGLSNRGLDRSTVASEAASGLERTAGEGRQRIAETGITQANQLRKDVEQARQQAISQLYQSADPAQAVQGAVRSAIGFQAPSSFAPLANMFSGIANQYMTSQLLNNYRQPYGMSGEGAGNYFASTD
jgi:hypothetical protein